MLVARQKPLKTHTHTRTHTPASQAHPYPAKPPRSSPARCDDPIDRSHQGSPPIPRGRGRSSDQPRPAPPKWPSARPLVALDAPLPPLPLQPPRCVDVAMPHRYQQRSPAVLPRRNNGPPPLKPAVGAAVSGSRVVGGSWRRDAPRTSQVASDTTVAGAVQGGVGRPVRLDHPTTQEHTQPKRIHKHE